MHEFLTTRRSYKRSFAKRQVDPLIIQELVDTARWAPSAHNAQPWRYIAVLDHDRRQNLVRKMSDSFREDLARDNLSPEITKARTEHSISVFTHAPVLIVACGDRNDIIDIYQDERRKTAEDTMFIQSVANGICYFLLAAHARHLVACWYCAPLFTKDIVRNVLQLPASWDPQAFITLGYPEDAPISPPTRKSVEAILKIM